MGALKKINKEEDKKTRKEEEKKISKEEDKKKKEDEFDMKVKCMRRFGSELIKQLPERTYTEIEKLAKEIFGKMAEKSSNSNLLASYLKSLKEVLVDSKELTKRFLLLQTVEDPNCGQEVYHSLIEWHLQDYVDTLKSPQDTKEHKETVAKEIQEKQKALTELLFSLKDKYNKKHVLMLCEMYQVSEGIQLVCNLMQLKHELLEYYMSMRDYESVVGLCKEYGEEESDLWVQALGFLVGELQDTPGSKEVQEHIQQALACIANVPSISPMLALEIIARCSHVKLSVVKQYMEGKLGRLQKKIEKNRNAVCKLQEEIADLKQDVHSLRTTAQVFNLKECAECGSSKFDSAIIHFMCNHTFHEYCLSEASECPKCSLQNAQIIDKKKQLLAQRENDEQFFKELRESNAKLKVVAQYFGRGLFAGLKPVVPLDKATEISEDAKGDGKDEIEEVEGIEEVRDGRESDNADYQNGSNNFLHEARSEGSNEA